MSGQRAIREPGESLPLPLKDPRFIQPAMSIRTTPVVRERPLRVGTPAPKAYETTKILDDNCADVYRRHPFYKRPTGTNPRS